MKILVHWEQYGLNSTIHAFDVSERTLWNWKARFEKEGKKIEALNQKKRIPKNKRKRSWDFRILEEIKRLRNRDNHPNLGAEKLHPLLLEFCNALNLKCPSSSTVERLIKDMGGLRTFPQKVSHFGKIKKAKGFKTNVSGSCIGVRHY